MEESGRERLLVFNCHEAWVHQLGLLDYDLDIIGGLPGRHTQGWDSHVRPVPARARLIRLEDVPTAPHRYACIIAHNPTDLMDVGGRPEPRILVIHMAMETRLLQERSRLHAEQAKRILHRYVKLSGTHVVAVSPLKGRSWGFTEDIVPFAVDPNDYPPWSGETACGLRISNFVHRRRVCLRWSFHERAFAGLPVRLVGHNPDVMGAAPSQDWDHLKDLLRTHRFYIHTAHPSLEDGYNMATVEAMAAGLPVLGNCHPSSVVEHGVNGFVSDDPEELRSHARLLLENRDLALRLGQRARLTAQRLFSVAAFRSGMEHAIATARRKREALPRPKIIDLPRPSGRMPSADHAESPPTMQADEY